MKFWRRLLAVFFALSVWSAASSAEFEEALRAYSLGDYRKALKIWKPMAEQGLDKAQFKIGVMYQRGWGVREDQKEAVKWFRLAAKQEFAEAQHYLGAMYAEGRGVRQDNDEAVKWFRLAAKQEFAKAQHYLGAMYAEGRGVRQDDRRAVRWFRLAAEQGYADALNYLGAMYAQGRGVRQDDRKAVKSFRLAAKQGHADALNRLSQMYQEGRGAPPDSFEAEDTIVPCTGEWPCRDQFASIVERKAANGEVALNRNRVLVIDGIFRDDRHGDEVYSILEKYGDGSGAIFPDELKNSKLHEKRAVSYFQDLPKDDLTLINTSLYSGGIPIYYSAESKNAFENSNTILIQAAGNYPNKDDDAQCAFSGQAAEEWIASCMENTQKWGASQRLVIAGAFGWSGDSIHADCGATRKEYCLKAPAQWTSWATPKVTAALQLLSTMWPDLSRKELLGLLFALAEDKGAPGVDDVWGHGMLSFAKLFTKSGVLGFKCTKTGCTRP